MVEQPPSGSGGAHLPRSPRRDKGKVLAVVEDAQTCRTEPTRFMELARRIVGQATP